MINNYDSVVSCLSSGTPHSQKQESTSYTATKRNWLSFVTVLVALFCFSFMQGQTIFSQNFDGAWTLPSTLTPAWSGTSTGDLAWHKTGFTTGWSSTGGAYSPLGANLTSASARFHSYDTFS